MIPLGYLYKHVADRPEWLTAAHVADVYSLSGCVSKPFADYVGYWRSWTTSATVVLMRDGQPRNLLRSTGSRGRRTRSTSGTMCRVAM